MHFKGFSLCVFIYVGNQSPLVIYFSWDHVVCQFYMYFHAIGAGLLQLLVVLIWRHFSGDVMPMFMSNYFWIAWWCSCIDILAGS